MKKRIKNQMIIGALTVSGAYLWQWGTEPEISPQIKPIKATQTMDTGSVYCPRCGWDSTIVFYTQVIRKHGKRHK